MAKEIIYRCDICNKLDREVEMVSYDSIPFKDGHNISWDSLDFCAKCFFTWKSKLPEKFKNFVFESEGE